MRAAAATRSVERLARCTGRPIAPLALMSPSSFVSRKLADGGIVLLLVASGIGVHAVVGRRLK
jgi:hypothetical protein